MLWAGQSSNVHFGRRVILLLGGYDADGATVKFFVLEPRLGPIVALDLQGIGWVIVGSESGP